MVLGGGGGVGRFLCANTRSSADPYHHSCTSKKTRRQFILIAHTEMIKTKLTNNLNPTTAAINPPCA